MKSKSRLSVLALLVVIASLTFSLAQPQTSASVNKIESDSRPIVVDKVVANPAKFKNAPINVTGRVTKVGGGIGLFALSCEDECFSMPVKFSGMQPKPGSEVVVRGQLAKESNGRYVFNAESVTAKK